MRWNPAEAIIIEVGPSQVTFFDPDHKSRAKAGKHLHVDHFLQILPKLKNPKIVVLHVSRRTGVRRARRQLAKLLPPEQMARIHFLMDFEGAKDAGEVEDTAPPPPDMAE